MASRITSHADDLKKEVQEIGVALLLNVIVMAVLALLLWALGRPAVGLHFAKSYGVLWILLVVSIIVLAALESLAGINLDTHFNTIVVVNLSVSVLLVTGWSAFAALVMHKAAQDASWFVAGSLYVLGFLSCYLTFAVMTSFYSGSIYKIVTLPLALISFIVFALWPVAARTLFGWFFAYLGTPGL